MRERKIKKWLSVLKETIETILEVYFDSRITVKFSHYLSLLNVIRSRYPQDEWMQKELIEYVKAAINTPPIWEQLHYDEETIKRLKNGIQPAWESEVEQLIYQIICWEIGAKDASGRSTLPNEMASRLNEQITEHFRYFQDKYNLHDAGP